MARSGNKKSGYTSLSANLQIKDLANLKNSYPTVLRTGDTDRQGNYSLNFDDTLTHVYGKRIIDNFQESGFDNETALNSKKWQTSLGNVIKREIISGINLSESSRCFIFAGKGDAEGRWIQTIKKITNPTIQISVILGPYNSVKSGLNLSKPNSNQNLLIQTSTNLSSWKTIKTISANTNLNVFYNYSSKKLPLKPRKTINLSPVDFKESVGVYLRIIEESSSYNNNLNSIWAIDDISIEYYDNSVTYPTINNLSKSGMQVNNTLIAKSHSTSSLTVSGRIHKGVSDGGYIDRSFEERLLPFNETTAVSTAGETFLNSVGVDSNINENFNQMFFQKTRIDIDLSPSEETEVGYINPFGTRFPNAYQSTDGQQLMVYWNKNLKRWEKIAQPVTFNNNAKDYHEDNARANLQHILTSSAVGFSSLGYIATGSANQNKINTLHPKELVTKYIRPIDNFNFPFGGQYHATSSQILKAKDLGINHPFLLEGTSLAFDAKLEIAGTYPGRAADVYTSFAFAPSVSLNLGGNPSYAALYTDRNFKIIIPSFFMLRQHKCNFKHSRNHVWQIGNNQTSDTNLVQLDLNTSIQIPDNYDLSSGSQNIPILGGGSSPEPESLISDTRELITYKQITFIASSSNDSAASGVQLQGITDARTLLNLGLARDENVIIEDQYLYDQALSLTGSYKINSKVKIAKKIEDIVSYRISGSSGAADEILLGHSTGGRSRGELTSSPRGLYNNKPSFETEYFNVSLPNPTASKLPVDYTLRKDNNIDLESPYILFPEDEIILGWQYPLEQQSALHMYHTNSLSKNSMTFFRNAKLELYGSMIRDEKELHDTLNQNLTSNNIHELIHEKIVDRYQIATRCEMTGSYNASRLISFGGLFGLGTGSGYTVSQAGSEFTKTPSDRIGIKIVDISNLVNSMRSMQSNIITAGSYPYLYTNVSSKMKGLNKFIKLSSTNLKYKDNNRKLDYYYDYRQFGLKSDLIRGSKDSNLLLVKSAIKNSKIYIPFTGPAIKVNFIKNEVTIDDNKIRIYKKGIIDNLIDSSNFQSSNISTACTSSLPYFDDNNPRNRNYSTAGAFIAV